MTNDYTKIKIPELTKKQIEKLAQEFRSEHWAGKESPLNILDIVEFDLGMNLIPIPGLEELCATDAFITSDWKSVCIDKKQYEDPRYDRRTNFSVAHEISHFVLHKIFFESLKICDLAGWYRFIEDCPQSEYAKLEKQAHRFAAALLMPVAELRNELEILLNQSKKNLIKKDQILKILSDKFQVSEKALKVRIAYDLLADSRVLKILTDA